MAATAGALGVTDVLVTAGKLGVRELRAEMLPEDANGLELGALVCKPLPLTELGPECARPLADTESSRVGVAMPFAKLFPVLGVRGVSELPTGRELGAGGRELGFSGASPAVNDDCRAGAFGSDRGGTEDVSSAAPSGGRCDTPFGSGV